MPDESDLGLSLFRKIHVECILINKDFWDGFWLAGGCSASQDWKLMLIDVDFNIDF